jgi:alkylation response protein AidB-like acyl-CoA dehydrogenase
MSALTPAAIALIREHAAEAERRGELHPEVLALIYEQQWFRMLAPRQFGGLALPLPTVVRLEEELARADGSVGWTVTLCSGAGWFAGFFAPGLFDRLFTHPRMCIAGSGMAAGRAERLAGGGYRVNGQWGYASGARHATAFTANCVVWADGAPVLEGGRPVLRPFLFLRDEVRVLADWNAVGLVATGSDGFVVSDLEVSEERCFVIDVSAAADVSPLYRYPFLPLAEATLAVNSSGMALHFFECFERFFSARAGRGHLSAGAVGEVWMLLEQARHELGRVREGFYTALEASWATAAISGAEAGSYDAVSRTSHTLAAVARQGVDRLYPFAGLEAARVDSEINRVWRDLHTASQHPLLAFFQAFSQGAVRPSA